ncbi:hypothetical protein R1flu_007203 [Riccia fluitans]|uniref:Uncharacterized protein n=1 Tax=Riccia fluitans TaxID=41844 RepID=A0ABD1Z0V6_9MARC
MVKWVHEPQEGASLAGEALIDRVNQYILGRADSSSHVFKNLRLLLLARREKKSMCCGGWAFSSAGS